MAELVGSHLAGRVLELEIRRTERRNALDLALTQELATALRDAPTHADAVLLHAAGPSFCAGYDLRELDLADRERLARSADELVAPLGSPLFEALDASPIPIVAAIQGSAVGGGLELALACDLRVAAEDASFGFPAGRLGLVYSHEGAARAVRALGSARAKELLLLGEAIDAGTALAWGVVQRVVAREELLARARDIAQAVAAQAPLAQRGNRRLLQMVEAAGGALPPEQVEEARRLRSEALASIDFMEGATAFRERRAPKWQGR